MTMSGSEHYVPKKCECGHKDKRHNPECDVRDCGCKEMKEIV